VLVLVATALSGGFTATLVDRAKSALGADGNAADKNPTATAVANRLTPTPGDAAAGKVADRLANSATTGIAQGGGAVTTAVDRAGFRTTVANGQHTGYGWRVLPWHGSDWQTPAGQNFGSRRGRGIKASAVCGETQSNLETVRDLVARIARWQPSEVHNVCWPKDRQIDYGGSYTQSRTNRTAAQCQALFNAIEAEDTGFAAVVDKYRRFEFLANAVLPAAIMAVQPYFAFRYEKSPDHKTKLGGWASDTSAEINAAWRLYNRVRADRVARQRNTHYRAGRRFYSQSLAFQEMMDNDWRRPQPAAAASPVGASPVVGASGAPVDGETGAQAADPVVDANDNVVAEGTVGASGGAGTALPQEYSDTYIHETNI
jgi:hypothetical protein